MTRNKIAIKKLYYWCFCLRLKLSTNFKQTSYALVMPIEWDDQLWFNTCVPQWLKTNALSYPIWMCQVKWCLPQYGNPFDSISFSLTKSIGWGKLFNIMGIIAFSWSLLRCNVMEWIYADELIKCIVWSVYCSVTCSEKRCVCKELVAYYYQQLKLINIDLIINTIVKF